MSKLSTIAKKFIMKRASNSFSSVLDQFISSISSAYESMKFQLGDKEYELILAAGADNQDPLEIALVLVDRPSEPLPLGEVRDWTLVLDHIGLDVKHSPEKIKEFLLTKKDSILSRAERAFMPVL